MQTEAHILPELSYLRNARWWMVGEQPPKQSSKRNLATSSGDILDSFLCTPSRTRIVAAFVSITTSNCNNKNYIMRTIPIISERPFESEVSIWKFLPNFFLHSTQCDTLTAPWKWKTVMLATLHLTSHHLACGNSMQHSYAAEVLIHGLLKKVQW